MNKICNKCREEKDLSDFYYDSIGGKQGICKKCRKIYYEENKTKIAERNKKYREANKDKRTEYNRNHKKANKKKYANRAEYYKRYAKNKRKTDEEYKLLKNLRRRIRTAIKSQYGTKAYKSIDLLGCTIEQCRKHLEQQFTEGIVWENYGKWHIDHIRPCASFDLTDPAQQKQCFHYTNLQPLWAKDNLSKSDKWDWK